MFLKLSRYNPTLVPHRNNWPTVSSPSNVSAERRIKKPEQAPPGAEEFIVLIHLALTLYVSLVVVFVATCLVLFRICSVDLSLWLVALLPACVFAANAIPTAAF